MIGLKQILAVIVLYRVPAESSQAFCSLRDLLECDPDAAAAIDLVLFDNSPFVQPQPAGFAGPYIVDTTNPGLAACYNQALRMARDRAIRWLLLLDQDTTLTEAYLREALAAIDDLGAQPGVAALVPRLCDDGVVCSPTYPPSFGPAHPLESDISGVTRQRLHVFNSGSIVNCEAIEAAGGFAEDFPLDYLDHATFAALHARDGNLYVLSATLQHELSSNHEATHDKSSIGSIRRQQSTLDAEYRFYHRYGSPQDRILRRLRLFRACAGRVLRGKDKGQTWRMLKSALRP